MWIICYFISILLFRVFNIIILSEVVNDRIVVTKISPFAGTPVGRDIILIPPLKGDKVIIWLPPIRGFQQPPEGAKKWRNDSGGAELAS